MEGFDGNSGMLAFTGLLVAFPVPEDVPFVPPRNKEL